MAISHAVCSVLSVNEMSGCKVSLHQRRRGVCMHAGIVGMRRTWKGTWSVLVSAQSHIPLDEFRNLLQKAANHDAASNVMVDEVVTAINIKNQGIK
jgi:hypothetical protein